MNMNDHNNTMSAPGSGKECPLCKIYHTPNETTLAAIRELEEGGGKRCNTVEELMADLNSVDDK